MSVHRIDPKPTEGSYISLPITAGSEFASGAHHDAWSIHKSHALGEQTLKLRCFAPPLECRISEGVFEVRFNPEEMREALRMAEELP